MPALVATIQDLLTKHERLTTVSAGALILMAITVMGLVSLMTLNTKATKGYVLNELEEERQELISDGEITEMLILRASAMSTIQDNEQVRRMVEPGKDEIVYVVPMNVVAQR